MSSSNSNELSVADERSFTGIGNVLGILGIIPSLVVYLVYRERSAFLNRNIKSALNFQITMIIAEVVGYILSIIVVGVFIVVAAWVLRFVFSILAFVKTKDGEDYTYPFTFTFIK